MFFLGIRGDCTADTLMQNLIIHNDTLAYSSFAGKIPFALENP